MSWTGLPRQPVGCMSFHNSRDCWIKKVRKIRRGENRRKPSVPKLWLLLTILRGDLKSRMKKRGTRELTSQSFGGFWGGAAIVEGHKGLSELERGV